MNGKVIAPTTSMRRRSRDDIDSTSRCSRPGAEARYCAVIKNFLMLANTTDAGVRKSAANAPVEPRQRSDHFPTLGTASAAGGAVRQPESHGDGGWIQGHPSAISAPPMARSSWSTRLCVSSSRAAGHLLLPAAEGVRGTPARLDRAARRLVYYLGEDGFYVFDGPHRSRSHRPGGPLFLRECDQSKMFRIVGRGRSGQPADRLGGAVSGNSGGNPNVLLIYNWPSTTGPSSASTSRTSSAR